MLGGGCVYLYKSQARDFSIFFELHLDNGRKIRYNYKETG